MGLSSILRGAGRGVASIGRAVGNATQNIAAMAQPPAPAQAAPAAPVAAPSEGAPAEQEKGFKLPVLAAPPDPASPEFQGEVGAAKLAEAQEDYAHRQKVHDSLLQLDRIFQEAHPGRDFQGEYQQSLQEQKQNEAERPQGSTLARFALGLGDQNPAVKSSNLERYNKEVDSEQSRFDQSANRRTMLRLKMHEAAADEAETKGNWKKALAERQHADMLKFDEERRKAADEQKKVETQQSGATERATIKADAARDTATTRANAIGKHSGLKGTFLDMFMKEAAKKVAERFGGQALNKNYGSTDIEDVTSELEDMADMYERLQKRAASGGATSTGAEGPPPPPKKAAKDKF